MSNSSLVTYKHIVKNKTKGRGGNKIQKIFVHHMAGNLTVKQCGNVFDNRQASAHYGINGTAIGQYVDEADTAWHCGNFSWNQKSIGIELANDGGASTGWHVADKTIETAIKLIADICKRNGIQKLNYTGNMNGNLCMHKWVCSTSCPGPYLATQFKRIATGVNQLLSGGKIELDVDGIGGEMTTLRTQEFLGTPQDGIINGQIEGLEKYYPAWTTVVFDKTESTMVHALQWLVGVYEDGVLGPDTVKAVQKYLGVSQDGIWGEGTMKAWQKYLNSHDKAVFPATHVTKPTETPTPSKPTTTSNAAKLAAKANEFAYSTNTSKAKYPSGSPKAAYKAGLNKAYPNRSSWGKAPKAGASCDVFVGTCVRCAGIDSNFPRGLSPSYLAKSTKFKQVSKSSVQDGDIIVTSKHICIAYGGKVKEASYNQFYPKTTNTLSKRLNASGAKVYRAK